MFSNSLKTLAEKLSAISLKQFLPPFGPIQFEEKRDENAWYTSPELVSLFGTPVWDSMSEKQRKDLAFFEAVNFYSLNVHGEKALIEGLAHRLYLKENESVSNYIHHFLDEENKHMIYFGNFCMRYAGKVYPERKLNFPREYEPGIEDLLFFGKVLVFEEIVGSLNKAMAHDERLNPLAKQINFYHHKEETRHLAFGREIVKEIYQAHASAWNEQTKREISEYLRGYFVSTFKEYYNPTVYADAGLPDPYDLVDLAWNSESSRKLREQMSSGATQFFLKNGIIESAPELT